MRPEVAADLPEAERTGLWHALRADFPIDAFAHVRGRTDPDAGHDPQGDCGACSVYVLGSGSHQQALTAAESALGVLTPVQPPKVRVPYSLHWPHRL
jgi:hypothetical protein